MQKMTLRFLFEKRENKMMLSFFKANIRWTFCNRFQDCLVQWYLNVEVFLTPVLASALVFVALFSANMPIQMQWNFFCG